jgi:dipeptidyl-peptidase-4
MRFILCSSPCWPGPGSAEQLTLDRIHGDSSLSGPGVRSLKVSPDGARVTFLRGRDDNQFQLDLWEYNLKDKSTHRLVDSKILVPEENLSDAEKARRERERTPRSRASSATAGRRTASGCWCRSPATCT